MSPNRFENLSRAAMSIHVELTLVYRYDQKSYFLLYFQLNQYFFFESCLAFSFGLNFSIRRAFGPFLSNEYRRLYDISV